MQWKGEMMAMATRFGEGLGEHSATRRQRYDRLSERRYLTHVRT